jgi:peptidoglycan biosynthesis protein MviN/MurJ (putative lipid II flippase)
MMKARIALTALTIFSSLTSFVAHTLILRHEGASAELDLLFFASIMPTALAGLTSGVLLYLLPPTFTKVSIQVQERTLRVLFGCFVLVCAFAIAFELAYGLLNNRHEFTFLLVGFTLVGLLTIYCTLASCIAEVRGFYKSPSVASMVTSSGLLAGVVIGISLDAVWWMLIGQLFGAALAALWLSNSLGLKEVLRLRDVLRVRATLGPLRLNIVSVTMGTLAFTLFQPIDAALCAQLSSGSITVMSYAQRVVVAVSTSVSLGAYVVAARTAHDSLSSGGQLALQRLANREVFRLVGFGLAVWAIYYLGGHHFLLIVLGSSTMQDDDLVSLVECVQWMLLGVGPMAAFPYLFRIFYSRQQFRKPALVGICIGPAYGLLALTLLPQFKLLSLAYAYASVWWAALIVALFWLNRPTT